MTIASPRPASTVVLLKPSDRRFDVCLVRRRDEVAFMGGACVFPGGRVDQSDRADAVAMHCDGVDDAIARLHEMPRSDAVSHHVAAVREIFEEAGILLARREGRPLAPLDAETAIRLHRHRADLLSGATTLAAIAAQEHLRLALDALVLFGHWVTPESERKRYDVRFFVATAPPEQALMHDAGEMTEGFWIDPGAAVDRCRRGEMLLAPPTWTTLRALERFAAIDDVLAWARGKTRIGTVQPRLFDADEARNILAGQMPAEKLLALPGDELYPPVEGFDTPRETRFLFANGRWNAVEP